jgi:uncharacterized damage-inducible protein DinB
VAIKDALLPEFDRETGITRRLLERVPDDKLGWKPHQKSMTLGRLALHVAELPSWGSMVLKDTELNLDTSAYKPVEPQSRAEVLAKFDETVVGTRKALAEVTDGELMMMWTLKADGKAMFSMPRVAVIRGMVMNHMIHHRGQLSVYLRENDVPIPSIYGPSADEQA